MQVVFQGPAIPRTVFKLVHMVLYNAISEVKLPYAAPPSPYKHTHNFRMVVVASGLAVSPRCGEVPGSALEMS